MVIDFSKTIARANSGKMSDEEIAELAIQLAKSGDSINFSRERSTADIASTGGPASLSTLLTPLFLLSHGFLVPKLGVPGRPAGGVDVLSCIEGYRVNLSRMEINRSLDECGYAHFLAAGKFAPLDLEFFEYRKKHNALAIPELVVASILSKKIALDVRHVGLDIRISGHGNFGTCLAEGRRNAALFSRVAKLLNKKSVCILTDGGFPFQPYIGRGEALWALSQVFSKIADSWLFSHVEQCKRMAQELALHNTSATVEDAKKNFELNLLSQGATLAAFEEKVEDVSSQHIANLKARQSGFIFYDLGKLRNILVRANSNTNSGETFPDNAGVRLIVPPGKKIEKGDVILTYRDETGFEKNLLNQLTQVIDIRKKTAMSFSDEVVNVG